MMIVKDSGKDEEKQKFYEGNIHERKTLEQRATRESQIVKPVIEHWEGGERGQEEEKREGARLQVETSLRYTKCLVCFLF